MSVQSNALDKQRQQQALAGSGAEERYRQLALRSCDIVDLANLPESDRHIATRHLELRRLYVSLRVRVEETLLGTDDDAHEGVLDVIERRRQARPSDREAIEEREKPQRVSIGERLSVARRLVVLGEPGSGKNNSDPLDRNGVPTAAKPGS